VTWLILAQGIDLWLEKRRAVALQRLYCISHPKTLVLMQEKMLFIFQKMDGRQSIIR
jgi:hypothetical protein